MKNRLNMLVYIASKSIINNRVIRQIDARLYFSAQGF